jgi:hypothetical protein
MVYPTCVESTDNTHVIHGSCRRLTLTKNTGSISQFDQRRNRKNEGWRALTDFKIKLVKSESRRAIQTRKISTIPLCVVHWVRFMRYDSNLKFAHWPTEKTPSTPAAIPSPSPHRDNNNNDDQSARKEKVPVHVHHRRSDFASRLMVSVQTRRKVSTTTTTTTSQPERKKCPYTSITDVPILQVV